MKLLLTLGLVSLVMCMSVYTAAQAAGRRGCCTAVSKDRVVNFMVRRGGAVRCRLQDIREGCNINAVILEWRRRQVCVDPTSLKTQNQLANLCNRRAKGVRHRGRPHSRKTKI
ncbi:unnamed protein product [Pleuronectes platessa]|uniref:Chemokine interleukin-8-like domain-containing protein n=1 Tax=Pleuronectes platessa TaxID=8262 RepID=A0A9N7VVJ2_PLEPL|nr:unnamed protein product [Pleuronectes platessa]